MAFNLIMTLDYELPAGGRGDVRRHMTGPTARLLDVCDNVGARLTIMVEIGELWAFEDPANAAYAAALGYDPAREIREQLAVAVARGHDVQLHLHPQWIGARWTGGEWRLNYDHYRLNDFSHSQAVELLRTGRADLEETLRPYRPDYTCVGFRAGHWSTSPTERYLAALRAAGLRSDCSAFKWGYAAGGAARFDYRGAASNVRAWVTRPDDLNRAGAPSPDCLLEVPIATRLAGPLAFMKPRRLALAWGIWREGRAIRRGAGGPGRDHAQREATMERDGLLRRIFKPRPLKLDFCKLSARELLAATEALMNGAAEEGNGNAPMPVPLMTIGHSKQLGERNVESFLKLARRRFGEHVGFSTYRAFVEKYGAVHGLWAAPGASTHVHECEHEHGEEVRP